MQALSIKLDQALKEMKSLTKKGSHFSFTYRSYSESKDATHGDVHVSKAILRKKSKNDLLLQYVDVVQERNLSCYECLLKTFNGKQIQP
jgi:acyl-CoA-binding protein